MYREVSKLLLYGDLGEDSILCRLADIFEDWKEKRVARSELVRRIYAEIKRLLDLATVYGFDQNLWHNYLTFLLMTNENSFSLTCERIGAQDGSVNHFARNDFAVFYHLFHFDFGPVEHDLGLDCFTTISQYQAIVKRERRYDANVSERVQKLSAKLAGARNNEEIFQIVTHYYAQFGVGMFGLNRAFRIKNRNSLLEFCPIQNTDQMTLNDLVGYEGQKRELKQNTDAFVNGDSANNVLLYGDSGTGKSSSVKALMNEYYDRGLRMIEIYKHQFQELSEVIAQTKNRNYFFIIFIDDLSFEETEVEYKFLKAVIEGGVETKPDNILIYATSNRRHLIREMWQDKHDMEYNGEIHRSDTVEEKLSLSSRFGVQIQYSIPNRRQFKEMVAELAKRKNLYMSEETLFAEANKWELRHGGVSGRTAQQFINDLAGKAGDELG